MENRQTATDTSQTWVAEEATTSLANQPQTSEEKQPEEKQPGEKQPEERHGQEPMRVDVSVLVSTGTDQERPMVAVAELPVTIHDEPCEATSKPIQKRIIFEGMLTPPTETSEPQAQSAPQEPCKTSKTWTRQALFAGLVQQAFGAETDRTVLAPGGVTEEQEEQDEPEERAPEERSLVVREQTEVTVFDDGEADKSEGAQATPALLPDPNEDTHADSGIDVSAFSVEAVKSLLESAQAKQAKLGKNDAPTSIGILPTTPIVGQAGDVNPEGNQTTNGEETISFDHSLITQLGWGKELSVPASLPVEVPWLEQSVTAAGQTAHLSTATLTFSTPETKVFPTAVTAKATQQSVPHSSIPTEQKPPVESQPIKPEAAEQETKKPEAAEQETKKPEAAEQKPIKSAVTKQETKKPEVAEQETKKPEVAEQKTIKSAVTEQETKKPEATEQETKKPEAAEQKPIKSAVTEQETKKPEIAEQKTVKSAVTEQETNMPDVGEQKPTTYVSPKPLTSRMLQPLTTSTILMHAPEQTALVSCEETGQSLEESWPTQTQTVNVPVQGLAIGVVYALGDAIGLVVKAGKSITVKVTNRENNRQPPRQITAQTTTLRPPRSPAELPAYMGGRVFHGIKGVVSGGGLILRGGKEVVVGSVGCLAGAAGHLTHELLAQRQPEIRH